VLYDITIYGNEALRRKAQAVPTVDDRVRKLAQDMLETMYAGKGLGLAAEQIGRDEHICVIDIPPLPDGEGAGAASERNSKVTMPLVLVNADIVERDGRQNGQEGCLSFPEVYVNVERAERIKVTYTSLENEETTIEADGLLARAIQHELDHLNGVLLVDHMSPVQKVGVAGKLKRLKKQGKAQGGNS